MKNILLLATWLAMITSGKADIRWLDRTASIEAHFSDKSADAKYTFLNSGDKPVTITKIQTSCGCTSATSNKKTYQAGEKGSIEVQFTIGERTGLQHKLIDVYTDDQSAPLTVLQLDVNIPELVQARPVFLNWQKSESLAAKSVEITPAKGFTINQVKVASTNAEFTAESVKSPKAVG
jgi:hypothetical protein